MAAFSEWKKIVYRGVRTAIAAAVAQAWAVKVDWSNPEEGVRTLVASFVAGFLVALGMWVRDFFKPTDMVSKVLPI